MSDFLFIKMLVHYLMHFFVPALLAKFIYKSGWRKAYYIMLATMLVDLDHVFATPMFHPDRNSIGFHPLHTYPMIVLYALGTVFLKGNYRIIAIGLLFHMYTDFQDYYFWTR